ncbi:ATP-dependent DNA helicase RecQ [Flavobacteriaceae bacterium M23B6Z8]
MREALNILQKYWGHASFRYPQEEIITAVLEKKDTLALLPTGGGKSVCFQIPALLQPGICLVISPLIALMNDQAAVLNSKKIKTIALTGNINHQELDRMLDNAIYGNYKFLYLSPERLKQELVMDRIRQMPLNLIAVDEAHCISQWGSDFRPSYRDIAWLREPFPHVPIIALTATATQKVREDIIRNLEFKDPQIFIKSFARPNLSYHVINSENKFQKTTGILNQHEGSAIIYVRNRKATIAISDYLKNNGITADFYHGGISAEDKQHKLDSWLANNTRVMVATNAFGMGIDKSNVRVVIHLALPENLENYYQEAGRAGRDGKTAFAYLIVAENDEALVKKQFLKQLPDTKFVKLLYRKLNNYLQIAYGEGEDSTYRLRLTEFCAAYELPVAKAYNAMKLLDRYGVLRLSESFHRKSKIKFIVSTNQLFTYLDRNRFMDVVTRAILRTYGGIFDVETAVNLNLISKKTGTPEKEVLTIVAQLEKDGIVNYTSSHTDAEITFLVPREDEQTINPLSKDIEAHLKLRQQQVFDVITYIKTKDICRNRQLLAYFGQPGTTPCGVCSVCLSNTTPLKEKDMNRIAGIIMKVLKGKIMKSEDIIASVNFEEAIVLKVLRSLIEKGEIILTSTNQYSLTK